METATNQAFFFHSDGTVRAVPVALLHDLRAGRVEIPEYAGQCLRYAIVRVDMGERETAHLWPMWCGILHFDDHGRRDKTMIQKQRELTVEALAGSFRKSPSGVAGRVVDARGQFAQRQLDHRFAWIPTEQELGEMRRLVERGRSSGNRLTLLS